MTVYQYTAVPLSAIDGPASLVRGEHEAPSMAEARSALLGFGLQPLELRPQRAVWLPATWFGPLRGVLQPNLRRRRGRARAELFDALATLIQTGIPLLEALETMAESRGRSAGERRLLRSLGSDLRRGERLSTAMLGHPSWFDTADCSLVSAGEHAGELVQVLRAAAARQSRSSELSQKFLGAMAYPLIVTVVGVGVTVFLSVKTLPELLGLLVDANIDPPGLSQFVMAAGQTAARVWPLVPIAVFLFAVAPPMISRLGRRYGSAFEQWGACCTPRLFREILLARLAIGLSELVAAGVPLVEAMGVLAPTLTGSGSGHLRSVLEKARTRLEAGDDLPTALADPRWFDGEFRQMLVVGQASGELDSLMQTLGERTEARARRAVDRLTALLEPAAILLLAILVGTVVMAAVLPLLRLQEILQ